MMHDLWEHPFDIFQHPNYVDEGLELFDSALLYRQRHARYEEQEVRGGWHFKWLVVQTIEHIVSIVPRVLDERIPKEPEKRMVPT